MDPYSSGEDLIIKTRKPYTITKQRERWTKEEHNRFLEALKLYGRAWRRIEEHLGTKTAVQIRSHAQKFFTKLEKEALVKGVPIGKAIDIEIPPPRPKRKPSNPYPKKTNATPASQVGSKDAKILTTNISLLPGKHVPDLEKEPLPEKTGADENLGKVDEKRDEDNSSEMLSLSDEAPFASLSSANGNSVPKPVAPRNSCAFREFVPILKEGNAACDTSELGNSHPAHEKSTAGQKKDELSQPENFTGLSTNDIQVPHNCPRNVPVHFLDGSTGMRTPSVSPDLSYQESVFHHAGIPGPNMFANPATSATTEHHNNAARPSIHQSFASIYLHFAPFCNNPDDYQSFLQLSSTFSSLVLSALLQNPAAHAAASFAATFSPCANVEASADSPAATQGGYPSRQINSAPSVAAIAAATVAAATAWWAAHGLFPLCAPIHTGFACSPSLTATQTDNSQAREPNNGKIKTAHDPVFPDQQLDAEYSEAVQEKHSASKLLSSSSLDSEESENTKVKTSATAAETEQAVQVSELHDSNRAKSRKQVDRSSCGSNTPSSSEVETDALQKHEKGNDESKEPDVTHPASDYINRRGRSSSNSNDSWKEVSEEGRLAFQALFSREVLPQSFFPPHDLKKDELQKSSIKKNICIVGDKNEDILMLDLGDKRGAPCSSHQDVETNLSIKSQNNGEDGLLTIGLGHSKLQACRTGFKPYKRCLVEAKESRGWMTSASNPEEEKSPKRIRLEGEAAT